VAVYVREAHPVDGAFSANNENAGIIFKQPRSYLDRTDIAKTCSSKLAITMPLVVDTIDDRVGHAYSGMPDRLYVIDRAGKVAYQGGRGPFGFLPGEMEQSLITVLLEDETREAPRTPSR
jgi:Iodothyronine deiodinase